MARITAQIVSDKITPKLTPALYGDEFEPAARRYLEAVRDDAAQIAPEDTGALKRSLRVYAGRTVAGIRSDSRKARYVHGHVAIPAPPRRRSIPHFPPNTKALRDWSARHGLPPYRVRLAIARRGTPIIPFISEAVDNNRDTLERETQAAARAVERKWSR